MDYDKSLKLMFKNKYQLEYSNNLYPKKSRNDKIDCLICGGHYTRQTKYTHEKTRKHLQGINSFYCYITDF